MLHTVGKWSTVSNQTFYENLEIFATILSWGKYTLSWGITSYLMINVASIFVVIVVSRFCLRSGFEALLRKIQLRHEDVCVTFSYDVDRELSV